MPGRYVMGSEHHPNCYHPWQQCICAFSVQADPQEIARLYNQLNELEQLIKKLKEIKEK